MQTIMDWGRIQHCIRSFFFSSFFIFLPTMCPSDMVSGFGNGSSGQSCARRRRYLWKTAITTKLNDISFINDVTDWEDSFYFWNWNQETFYSRFKFTVKMCSHTMRAAKSSLVEKILTPPCNRRAQILLKLQVLCVHMALEKRGKTH